MRSAGSHLSCGVVGCCVIPANGSARARAKAVSATLDLPLVLSAEGVSTQVALVIDIDDGWLQVLGPDAPGPVRVDFASPAMLHRRKGGQNELLGRAVGVRQGRRPAVFDATAGLGRDSFVLADLGCAVTMAERTPALAWLLNTALERAMVSSEALVRAAADRLLLLAGDCTTMSVPDGSVLYLDPMFESQRGSAAVKKDLSALRLLHGTEASSAADDQALIEWAWGQPCSRIVVKRASKAPLLTRIAPSHQLHGKAVRFDVYVR